jgi:hypothetical protein
MQRFHHLVRTRRDPAVRTIVAGVINDSREPA